MLAAPGDTDLAAYVKTQRFLLQLGKRLVRRSRHRAGAYMRLGHHTLALCCNHGPLHNLDDAGNKLSAKIHCGTANSPPGQFILYLLLFFTAGRHGQSYGRPADHDTGQPARRLFYYINHLLTLLSAILPCYLQTLRLRSETIITN